VNGVAPERLPGLIGHELRNPLASAMTGALLARDMVDDADPRAPVIDGVLRDLDRMNGLLDGWLNVARGKRTRRELVTVDELVAATAARHGVQVLSACPDAHLSCDRALLERALENLFENARNAGAKSVRAAVQTLAGQVTIHVEDDGGGIAADQLPQLFTAGFSGRGGTGLGLYAVQTTVAAHGGDVRCVALSRGTRFSITLPLAAAQTATA
jgi:two-component system osmolarity sensor histidine kinase EnvZ